MCPISGGKEYGVPSSYNLSHNPYGGAGAHCMALRHMLPVKEASGADESCSKIGAVRIES